MNNTAFLTALVLAMPFCTSAQTTTPQLDPMDDGEQVRQYVKSLLNPMSVVTSSISAGLGQWRDRPEEWGQGGAGYARRFASSYAQHVTYATMLFGASSLLHEDHRYIPSGETATRSRVAYALESTILARHQDANGVTHRRISYSRIGALVGAFLVSRSWQPESTRNLHGGIASVGTSIGVSMGFNLLREFRPGWLPIP